MKRLAAVLLLAFLISGALGAKPGQCVDYTPPFLTPMYASPGNVLSPDTNRYCPVSPASPLSRTLVPPEALALGRIFNHFAWPTQGVGAIPGYTKAGITVGQTSLAQLLDGQRPYPYPLPATAKADQPGALGAARLFADLSAALGATFGDKGSLVNATLSPGLLADHFRYSRNASLVLGRDASAGACGAFMAVLENEAEHGRPALLRLGDPALGQVPLTGVVAGVVDGYDRRDPARHLVHVVFGNGTGQGQWLALNASTNPVPGLPAGCSAASAIIGIRPVQADLTLLSPVNASRIGGGMGAGAGMPQTTRANGPFRFTAAEGPDPATPFSYYQVQLNGPGGWSPDIFWPATSCQKGAGICEVYFKASGRQTTGVHQWRARGIAWTPSTPLIPGPWTAWRAFNATPPELVKPLLPGTVK